MSGTQSIAGLTVMVIDDSNTIRRSAEIFLKQGGYQVVLAEDGVTDFSIYGGQEPIEYDIFVDPR